MNIKEENKKLQSENNLLKKEIAHLKQNLEKKSRFDINKYKNSEEDISFYTGFPDYDAMHLCYKIVEESSKNISYNYEGIHCRMQFQTVR